MKKQRNQQLAEYAGGIGGALALGAAIGAAVVRVLARLAGYPGRQERRDMERAKQERLRWEGGPGNQAGLPPHRVTTYQPADPAGPSYEHDDLTLKKVWPFFATLTIITAIFFVVTAGLEALHTGHLPQVTLPPPGWAISFKQPQAPGAQPALQTNAVQDLQQFRASEETKLRSYGWVDKNAGVVRIPIERAMDLIAAQGLPVRPQAQSVYTDTGQTLPSYSSSGRTMEKVTP